MSEARCLTPGACGHVRQVESRVERHTPEAGLWTLSLRLTSEGARRALAGPVVLLALASVARPGGGASGAATTPPPLPPSVQVLALQGAVYAPLHSSGVDATRGTGEAATAVLGTAAGSVPSAVPISTATPMRLVLSRQGIPGEPHTVLAVLGRGTPPTVASVVCGAAHEASDEVRAP